MHVNSKLPDLLSNCELVGVDGELDCVVPVFCAEILWEEMLIVKKPIIKHLPNF